MNHIIPKSPTTIISGKHPDLKPCPFCGNTEPTLVDDRMGWLVRCDECKPFSTVIYGENVRHIDHIIADTDEEADALAEVAMKAVDWDALKQTAVDAWNRRS